MWRWSRGRGLQNGAKIYKLILVFSNPYLRRKERDGGCERLPIGDEDAEDLRIIGLGEAFSLRRRG